MNNTGAVAKKQHLLILSIVFAALFFTKKCTATSCASAKACPKCPEYPKQKGLLHNNICYGSRIWKSLMDKKM